MQLTTARIEINLAKIAYNAKKLLDLYGSKGIDIMGVTKGVCGDTTIATVLIKTGIQTLTDSKLINIKKMRDANLQAQFVLLKTPALNEVDSVVKYADISINTELAVIKKLSTAAQKYNIQHKIILMIEMGDLREGIMPEHLDDFVQETLKLAGIKIVGIGANFACFGGVKPSEANMGYLSSIANEIEMKFSLPLLYVSGGNSANYSWFMNTDNIGKINNLRLGESIYLGRETLNREAIPELFTDAFTFVSEIIESKIKPSVPYGEIHQNTQGIHPKFQDRGQITRAILGVGSQDVLVKGLTPKLNIDILGSSSDHTIIDTKNTDLKLGDEVRFNLNYEALLTVMTSPYVSKQYIDTI